MKKNLEAAIAKLPKYGGETYRGMGWYKKEDFNKFFSDNLDGKDQFTIKSFWSTSKSQTVAGYFAEKPYRVMATIEKNKSGALLGKYGFGSEQEVLVPPNTKYSIVGMKKQVLWNGDVVVNVKLVEEE